MSLVVVLCGSAAGCNFRSRAPNPSWVGSLPAFVIRSEPTPVAGALTRRISRLPAAHLPFLGLCEMLGILTTTETLVRSTTAVVRVDSKPLACCGSSAALGQTPGVTASSIGGAINGRGLANPKDTRSVYAGVWSKKSRGGWIWDGCLTPRGGGLTRI